MTPFFTWYLYLTALGCGALVMVIEVLGSRIIGPFYGVSLFVWTSLITVTMLALALGYAAGGVLSDRRERPGFLYGAIALAGVFSLLVPLLKVPVLKACQPLGLRVGALASATLLFGPALFLLGMVSPYVVKIAARELRNLGRTVGVFYAVSTAGSFVGTVLTGFFLIGFFRVDQIFRLTGGLLLALAAGYFLGFGRKWAAAALFLPLLIPGWHPPTEKVLASGVKVEVVHTRESFYGQIKVLDYTMRDIRSREMMIDGLTQGGVDRSFGISIYGYPYLLQFLPVALHPGGTDCLSIGLGAGVVPAWYGKRGVRTDVVEIDPRVVETAERYFGFRASGEVFVEDARSFINRGPGQGGRTYDYILLDVFSGDVTPGHVLSLEALRGLEGLLKADGILAMNMIGTVGEKGPVFPALVRTLREVFPQVEVHPLFDPEEVPQGNSVIVAYRGEPRTPDPAILSREMVHPLAQKEVGEGFFRTIPLPDTSRAFLLTDDYNPLDLLDLEVREEVRRLILENNDWDILAGS